MVLMIRIIQGQVQEILQDSNLVDRIVASARNLLSFRLVAQAVLPDSFEKDEKTATNIVASVLQQVLGDPEYTQIASRNQEAGVKRGLAVGRRAAGIVEWPQSERARLAELAATLRHVSGRQKGRPDCEAIAQVLNSEFHAGQALRTRQATANMLVQLYKDGFVPLTGEEVETHPWSAEEDKRFIELLQSLVHPPDHQHAGRPDFALIAVTLNDEFYPEQMHEGEAVRTSTTCNRHAAIIRKRQKK